MSDESKFGELRLSVKGTNNGRGFDIFYDFGKSHNFVEFSSAKEFYFIQPWMQFPSQEYTDECIRVSVELVHRFNNYPIVKKHNEDLTKFFEQVRADKEKEFLRGKREIYEAIVRAVDNGKTSQEVIDEVKVAIADIKDLEKQEETK